ncbi:low molecular weight neuronal intermediate filament-like isoform X1 [Astatotilapia calliptera]|uniref:low molecular weight neuronal intermediate filament-like isoform X1 n=1 Tax=Astatotilapia calliptera TaxID=8154 RepID=UPI000E41F1A8|nr:low molecular weight neuronal intermediate filament-like isoform X1 [Astatotilapia calliptera]
MAMEKKELQLLNSLFATYIKKVNNQVNYQEHNESIHGIVEEKMKELLSMAHEEDNKEIIREQKTLTLRLEAEKKRREIAEDQLDRIIKEKVKAELDCEFQKKRTGLLEQEIQFLKEIYEEKINELQSQNQTETDNNNSDLMETLEKIRGRVKRISLEKHQSKMQNIESEFGRMKENMTKLMNNLKGYEQRLNNSTDLEADIEHYAKLLEKMKERINTGKNVDSDEGKNKDSNPDSGSSDNGDESE